MPANIDPLIWRPYTQAQTAPPALKLKSAKGAYLYNENGRRIFDGIASWWVITHGHCHPAIVEAVATQAGKLDQVLFANFSHDPAEELAEWLVRLTPPHLKRVFYTDNGSTAVESALKMALQARQQQGFPAKTKFLSFSRAYHGDTAGAMSVSAEGPFTRPYRPVLFPVVLADQPKRSSAAVEDFIADFRCKIEAYHQELAAVILEPMIQGAGGMVVWPAEAVREVADLCRKLNVYLILDEVMTGFGRTGTLFALERAQVVPDILCLSKGLSGGTLPLAATLVSDEIYQAFLSTDKLRMLFHGHSFTANPIACAAAVANIKVFFSEDTLLRIRQIENIHRRRLANLPTYFPIVDKRLCGSMAAIELEFNSQHSSYGSDFAERFMQSNLERGVFLRPLGHVIYMLPTYASTAADLDYAWDSIEIGLEQLLV